MLQEIRDLGFDYAELSHGIRISLLPGILEAVDEGIIKISTLHNFCPLPMGVNHAAPNIYQFTARETRERENAFRHTCRTIETAARVKAQLIVLHMGSVEMKDYTDKLIEMIEANQRDTPAYEKLLAEALEVREDRKGPHMELLGEMFKRITRQVEPHGIKLGLENREALEETLFEPDFQIFMDEFAHPLAGYWHDTGHAQIKENLGVLSHAQHLESMADRLLGFHIHDVIYPGRDHCPPGAGMIDFEALAEFVKPEHIKVFELHPGMAVEDVKRGVEYIRELWGAE
jgi:sugar phosphate isomerase/epimerase